MVGIAAIRADVRRFLAAARHARRDVVAVGVDAAAAGRVVSLAPGAGGHRTRFLDLGCNRCKHTNHHQTCSENISTLHLCKNLSNLMHFKTMLVMLTKIFCPIGVKTSKLTPSRESTLYKMVS